jgi:hypothetical protein
MNEKIDSFCKDLRAKLDGVDKRIKDLKAGAKSATEKAKVEAKAQLAALENRAQGPARQGSSERSEDQGLA